MQYNLTVKIVERAQEFGHNTTEFNYVYGSRERAESRFKSLLSAMLDDQLRAQTTIIDYAITMADETGRIYRKARCKKYV